MSPTASACSGAELSTQGATDLNRPHVDRAERGLGDTQGVSNTLLCLKWAQQLPENTMCQVSSTYPPQVADHLSLFTKITPNNPPQHPALQFSSSEEKKKKSRKHKRQPAHSLAHVLPRAIETSTKPPNRPQKTAPDGLPIKHRGREVLQRPTPKLQQPLSCSCTRRVLSYSLRC